LIGLSPIDRLLAAFTLCGVSLSQPSRTIVVEPIERPVAAPAPTPVAPPPPAPAEPAVKP